MILYRLLLPAATILGRAVDWLWDRYIADPPHPLGWWDEQQRQVRYWDDEPDPTSCDTAAVTEWIRKHRRQP